MRDLSPWHLLLILLIIVLVFGAAKLPDLARGTGQALRIFKAETRGLKDDEEKAQQDAPPAAVAQIEATKADLDRRQAQLDLERRQAELDAERAKLNDHA
jgi:sec-independent protein translocase protein TatA